VTKEASLKFYGTKWFYSDNPEGFSTLDLLTEHLHSLLSSSAYINETIDPDGPVLIESKELVKRINGMKIEIYSNEHPPPHFHVVTTNHRVSFSLDNCLLLDGSLPSKQVKKIEYWFHQLNAKKALVDIWNKTRPDGCVVGEYKE
jgi:hypothetical protein